MTAVLSPRIWFLGVPILLALVLYRPSPMLIIVAILAAPQLMQAFAARHPEVTLSVDVGNRERVFERLRTHRSDLAIGGRPPDDGLTEGIEGIPDVGAEQVADGHRVEEAPGIDVAIEP